MNIKPIKGLIREFFNSMDNIISDEYLLNYHILLEDSVLFYKYPEGFKSILTGRISNNVKEKGLAVYIEKGYVPKNMTLEDYRTLMKIYIPYRIRKRDTNNKRNKLKDPEFSKQYYEKTRNYVLINRDEYRIKQSYSRKCENILRRNISNVIYQINNFSKRNLHSLNLLEYLRTDIN